MLPKGINKIVIDLRGSPACNSSPCPGRPTPSVLAAALGTLLPGRLTLTLTLTLPLTLTLTPILTPTLTPTITPTLTLTLTLTPTLTR